MHSSLGDRVRFHLKKKKKKINPNPPPLRFVSVQDGTIVVSGPLLKDSVSVGALLIAQVDSFDAAETIVKNDPMKIGGAVESYTIGEWNPVLGSIR